MGTTVNTTVERIELTALDKGAKGVIDGVRGSVGNLRTATDTLNNALGAVGVTLGVGAMIAFAKDTLAATAALDDMAESTGASVEGLSAIRRVAQVGGHDFEGLTGQIAKTIKGLREGSDEGGRAAKALDFLGVKAKDGSGQFRDMSEVVIEVARSLDKYKDGGNKVALVQDALGRGAERYIPLLKDIAEGTDLVATTTSKQAEAADKAEKAMRRLGVTFEDNRRFLVNEYVPAFTDFMEQLTKGIQLFGGFGSALYNIGFGIDPFKGLQENLREINEELAKAKSESPYQQAMRGSVIGGPSIETLEKRRTFLMFQAQQQALRLVDDSNLDARDLRLRGQARGGKTGLTYQSPSEGGDAKARAVAERNMRRQFEDEERLAKDRIELQAYVDSELQKSVDARKNAEQQVINGINEHNLLVERAGQEYLDSEQDRQDRYFDNQLRMLIARRDQELLTEEEFNERRIELEIQHQERLTGVTNTAAQQRQRFIRSSLQVQAQTVFQELEGITAGVAQHNKALFQINKVAGIANAILNAHEGASKSLGAYPWPLAGIMAAIHYAAGIARVAAIAGTQFEGGGAGAAPSVAGSAPAQPVTPVPATPALPSQQRGLQTNVTIVTRGSAMARAVAEEIAAGLNELHKDGYPMTFAVKAA